MATVLAVALPALAAAGDLDLTYGTGGYLDIPDDGGPHWIGDMTARPGGETILTGSMIGGGSGSGEQSFWVAETAADGSGYTDADRHHPWCSGSSSVPPSHSTPTAPSSSSANGAPLAENRHGHVRGQVQRRPHSLLRLLRQRSGNPRRHVCL